MNENLVEMVAEGNDALMEEFFEQGTLPVEHIVDGLKDAIKDRRIFPIVCTGATQNIGTDLLLYFLTRFLPHAASRGIMPGYSKPTPPGARAETDSRRRMADNEALSVYVYKTVADAFAGRVSYLKVVSGVLKTDAQLVNFTRGSQERLGHLGVLMGKEHIPVPEPWTA